MPFVLCLDQLAQPLELHLQLLQPTVQDAILGSTVPIKTTLQLRGDRVREA